VQWCSIPMDWNASSQSPSTYPVAEDVRILTTHTGSNSSHILYIMPWLMNVLVQTYHIRFVAMSIFGVLEIIFDVLLDMLLLLCGLLPSLQSLLVMCRLDMGLDDAATAVVGGSTAIRAVKNGCRQEWM
jgi:hypothetical protein